MPVIPLVPSDSPTLISSLLRLSAHHLALAALASQHLKSGTPSYLSIPVPVLTPSVVISRPTTDSRPSTPLNSSPLAPQIRLCWPLCAFINYIYLLTTDGLLKCTSNGYLPHEPWLTSCQFDPCDRCKVCKVFAYRDAHLTWWSQSLDLIFFIQLANSC